MDVVFGSRIGGSLELGEVGENDVEIKPVTEDDEEAEAVISGVEIRI